MINEILNYAGGTQSTEIPVVADVLHGWCGCVNRHVVGVALDEHVIVLVVCDDLSNLAQRLLGTVVDLVAATLVEHVVGQTDINNALEHLHVDLFHLLLAQ